MQYVRALFITSQEQFFSIFVVERSVVIKRRLHQSMTNVSRPNAHLSGCDNN